MEKKTNSKKIKPRCAARVKEETLTGYVSIIFVKKKYFGLTYVV